MWSRCPGDLRFGQANVQSLGQIPPAFIQGRQDDFLCLPLPEIHSECTREDIFDSYTKECFEDSFKHYFEILESMKVKESSRVLYLMKPKSH